VRCPKFAEYLDRGETSLPRCLCIVDVPHRDFHRDVGPLAKSGDLDYRDAAPSGGGEAKRRIGRNRGWNEDGPSPARRLQEAMKPSHGDRLGVESDEPRQRADLSPNVPNFSRDGLRCPQILWSPARDPP
jgi:hypothetical protein